MVGIVGTVDRMNILWPLCRNLCIFLQNISSSTTLLNANVNLTYSTTVHNKIQFIASKFDVDLSFIFILNVLLNVLKNKMISMNCSHSHLLISRYNNAFGFFRL